MRDLAILLDAVRQLNQPICVWVQDAAYYFNQFAHAPEELRKSNLIVGALPGDTAHDGKPFSTRQPVLVSETRLGFGSFASSNLAQRFSNALVEWTLQ